MSSIQSNPKFIAANKAAMNASTPEVQVDARKTFAKLKLDLIEQQEPSLKKVVDQIRAAQAAVVSILPVSAQTSSRDAARLPVVISGGYETDPRDHGRPVVLVAGGLGVPPEVFRDAFSRVHPVAAGSYPEQERAQQEQGRLARRPSKIMESPIKNWTLFRMCAATIPDQATSGLPSRPC
ncbi:MAG: hypothetical protein K8R38_08200 [Verrucomicrobia bacterium]|nr:hypothetical protein [Verrucomicrobiota bacterium]